MNKQILLETGLSEREISVYLALLKLRTSTTGLIVKHSKVPNAKIYEILDKLALKMPIVGNIVFQATVARYARTLATTFAASVPLVDALDSVSGATGNIVYKAF